MPSQAFANFEANHIDEVIRIIKSHSELNFEGKGRRGLGHLTRSGILMLCAAWEVYIEELLKESVNFLCENEISPKTLPKGVQKELSNYVKRHTHDLKPLELACDGWKTVYKNHCEETIDIFNTPKSTNINTLYKTFLGIDELSKNWSLGIDIINNFINDRGQIAHKGREAKYITIVNLKTYLENIKVTAIETDNYLAAYIQSNNSGRKSPWRRRLSE